MSIRTPPNYHPSLKDGSSAAPPSPKKRRKKHTRRVNCPTGSESAQPQRTRRVENNSHSTGGSQCLLEIATTRAVVAGRSVIEPYSEFILFITYNLAPSGSSSPSAALEHIASHLGFLKAWTTLHYIIETCAHNN